MSTIDDVIQPGDVLFSKPNSLILKVLGVLGRNEFNHVSLYIGSQKYRNSVVESTTESNYFKQKRLEKVVDTSYQVRRIHDEDLRESAVSRAQMFFNKEYSDKAVRYSVVNNIFDTEFQTKIGFNCVDMVNYCYKNMFGKRNVVRPNDVKKETNLIFSERLK